MSSKKRSTQKKHTGPLIKIKETVANIREQRVYQEYPLMTRCPCCRTILYTTTEGHLYCGRCGWDNIPEAK